MPKQLSPEDSRAVDLVLDGESMQRGPMYAAVNNGVGERMNAAEDLLQLLDHLPAEDPPADLIRRTMQRIEDADATGRRLSPRAALAPGERPHA
jgi:hypothetical protein